MTGTDASPAAARPLGQPNRRYRVPRLALARAGAHVIFLDTDDDRYFGLAPAQNADILSLLDGGRITPDRARQIEAAIGGATILEDLRALLSRSLPRAVAEQHERVAPRLGHCLAALRHLLAATSLLKLRGLRAALESVAHARGSRKADSMTRSEVARAHVWLSRHLTAHDACLVRSLALARHARACGLDAVLVIAVKVDPFAAHSWVQIDDLLLNEEPDVAAVFRPILIVP